jgi:hypothetical protein
MKKKQSLPNKLQPWQEARQRYHLTDAQVQMARELGMNPRKFGKLDNHRQEPWKTPLPQFIEELYFKRFGKSVPDNVMSLEQAAVEMARKNVAKRQRRQERRATANELPVDEQEDEAL